MGIQDQMVRVSIVGVGYWELKRVRILRPAIGVASVVEIARGSLLLLAVSKRVSPGTHIWRMPCPTLTRSFCRSAAKPRAARNQGDPDREARAHRETRSR